MHALFLADFPQSAEPVSSSEQPVMYVSRQKSHLEAANLNVTSTLWRLELALASRLQHQPCLCLNVMTSVWSFYLALPLLEAMELRGYFIYLVKMCIYVTILGAAPRF